MELEGFVVQDILVRNISFTPEYANQIEAAQIAEVNIREEEFRVQAVEQQANQAKERARGEADAILILAEAEAEALTLIATALTQSPDLLEYQYVQNLSDNIGLVALPANSPYIFDLNSLINSPQNAVPSAASPVVTDTTDSE